MRKDDGTYPHGIMDVLIYREVCEFIWNEY